MDMVDLQDFNVQLARVNDASSSSVQVSELMELITDWMNDSFEHQLSNLKYANGKYASFDTVMVMERKERRALIRQATHLRRVAETTTSTGKLYTANVKGAALFSRNATQDSVPLDVVHFLQESALTNKSGLLELVQASGAAGLGASVVDLNAFTVATSSGSGSSGSGGNASLEAIIIIAVAVAAVAFLFLLVAIFWAWRYDRRNRQAYLVNGIAGNNGMGGGRHASSKETRRSDPTNSQSTIEEHIRRTSNNGGSGKGHRKGGNRKNQAPVSEIGGDSVLEGIPGTGSGMPSGLYPESVISEDISTALSQYYRSGLSYSHSAVGGGTGGGGSHPFRSSSSRMDHLNDAASVSSMESYGYSLDGYAPSTATPMPRDVAQPINYHTHASSSAHQPRDPEDDDDDDEEEYDEEDPAAADDDEDDEEVGPRVAADGLLEDADRDEEKF